MFAIVGLWTVFGKSAGWMRSSSSVAPLPRSHSSHPDSTVSHFLLLSLTPKSNHRSARPHPPTVRQLAETTRLHTGFPFPFWQAEIGVEHRPVELFALDLFRVLRLTLTEPRTRRVYDYYAPDSTCITR